MDKKLRVRFIKSHLEVDKIEMYFQYCSTFRREMGS